MGDSVWHTTGFNVIDNWAKVGKVGLVVPIGPTVERRTDKAGGLLADLRVRSHVLKNTNPGRVIYDWSPLTRQRLPVFPITSARLQTSITASNHRKAGILTLDASRATPQRLYTILQVYFNGVSLTQFVRNKNVDVVSTATKFTPDHKTQGAKFNSKIVAHKFPVLKANKGERKLWFGYKVLNLRPTVIRKPVGRKGILWKGKGAKVYNAFFYYIPYIEPLYGRYSGGITTIFAPKFTGRISG
jgi:hypothetical protein